MTGGEALYADSAISAASRSSPGWFFLVLPALLINYFGQGALVLSHPAAIENPFYLMVPESMLVPLIVLATAATVIASQGRDHRRLFAGAPGRATRQLPRFEVRFTSETHAGQIYLPRVNRLLLIGVLLLGDAVPHLQRAGLRLWHRRLHHHGRRRHHGFRGDLKLWNWKAATAAAVIVPFVIVDMTFLSANMLKLLEGAWVPFACSV